MTKEALKIALEALTDFNYDKRIKAIESIKEALKTKNEYERGFIDGMQKQMQSSVDKAVNAMSKREWVGLTDEEMQRMAKRIEELETEQDCVGWFGYDTGLRLWFEADKNDDGAIPLYKNALEMANRALETKDATVQVSPFEFVEMVMEKEHLIGQPIFWAQWPNKEKNT